MTLSLVTVTTCQKMDMTKMYHALAILTISFIFHHQYGFNILLLIIFNLHWNGCDISRDLSKKSHSLFPEHDARWCKVQALGARKVPGAG